MNLSETEKRALILNIAQSKVGIKENPAGSNNVIFNTLFYGHSVKDGYNLKGEPDKNAAYPWCFTSVSEIFQEAKLPLPGLQYRRGFAGVPFALSVLDKWAKEVSFEDTQPGDLIFYDWNQDGKPDHVGFVKTKDLKLRTVQALEGNTGIGNDSNGGEFMDRPRKVFGGMKFYRPNVYNS